MGIVELKALMEDLPADSPLRVEVQKVLDQVERINDEKSTLNDQNQELLRLLQEEQKRRDDLNQRVQINRITGLPNHNRMVIDLEHILQNDSNQLDTRRGAVFFLRLDRSFHTLQNTLKPQMTEWILYQIAGRMREYLGHGVNIYNSREDEFIVLLQRNLSMKEYLNVGRRLRQEVKRPHVLSGYNIHLDCHVGVALFPQHGREKGLLLQNADIALQVAEERDKEIIIFYERLREQVIEKMDLQNSILRALEQQAINEISKQFEIYYQPIVHLTPDESGSPQLDYGDLGGWNVESIGAEALIRWHHPTKGLISPNRFIPLAEETGLIIPIGNWIIYTVADQLRKWEEVKLPISTISVNISPRQFQSDTFLHTVRTAVKNNGLNNTSFRFEITETNLAQDPEAMIRTMWKLSDEGIYFYIDDFGTGYSSLSYVHQMPIKRIKIDKSFVLGLSNEKRREKTIIRTIIAMAKELGFGLVAEGVEDEAQLSYLLNYGVRSFQGYHFARPMNAESLERFIREKPYLPH